MDKIVRERLFSMSEEKYRDFSKALIPGCDNILGVRVPLIRKYARELLRENEVYQEICASQLSKEEVPYSVKTAN